MTFGALILGRRAGGILGSGARRVLGRGTRRVLGRRARRVLGRGARGILSRRAARVLGRRTRRRGVLPGSLRRGGVVGWARIGPVAGHGTSEPCPDADVNTGPPWTPPGEMVGFRSVAWSWDSAGYLDRRCAPGVEVRKDHPNVTGYLDRRDRREVEVSGVKHYVNVMRYL
ncbi:hypothetical protein BN12_70029 [Nostocoides japonicum T1-X7]|uniref:Uncharacterized protein n=1 Tax=Nostocoides japonicum T1-X7 TaxID=1194083 RepID=A0A077M0Z4_9MICO|nr:hypothetical protein BN12_70029 [Tetrasphaera japonica T1-X7]